MTLAPTPAPGGPGVTGGAPATPSRRPVPGPPPTGPARARPPVALVALGVGVVGYLALGKGFAYAGVPPVFVGEVLLLVVLLATVGPAMPVPRTLPAGMTAALVGMAAIQVVVERLAGRTSWLETGRGLAPVYYSAFAFAAYAGLRTHEARVGRAAVAAAVRAAAVRVAPALVVVATALAALLLVDPEGLPRWPASGQVVLASKSGDLAVTLVLVLPLLARAPRRRRGAGGRAALLALWGVAALLVAFRSRGALLALVAGLLAVRPNGVRLARGVAAVVVAVLVLAVSGLSFEVRGREVSDDALGDAVASMLRTVPEDEVGGTYVGTVDWRTDWWGDIWRDVTDDAMVLHGHGWGDNLAVRYLGRRPGVGPDEPALRLPHDIFFSLAGRAGVVVAVVFLSVPVLTVAATFRAGRRRSAGPPGVASPAAVAAPGPGRRTVASPAVVAPPGPAPPVVAPPAVEAARGAVVAALVTGLFDVYLESPQGAVVLWSLVGYLWWAVAPAAPHPEPTGAGEPAG
ncbi:MAG TPA: O-antigen ligase family protein [Acidimicrobiales bacterium]|nr:O-antigen ligase family protein [Acidimicrobiales bacterium]